MMSGGFWRISWRSSSFSWPGVAPEGDRRAMTPRAVAEELVEFLLLAVGQGVHRVDDDRLDALARPGPQDVVDDRDDVAEALARTGAGREHVVAVVACCSDRIDLVAMQCHLACRSCPRRTSRRGRSARTRDAAGPPRRARRTEPPDSNAGFRPSCGCGQSDPCRTPRRLVP